MSMLGKILAILNVLAVVGFFYLAAWDWTKRTQWEDAALHYDLVITGLPVDEQEKDQDGFPRVKDLPTPLINRLFKEVGGQPVKTQKEEVERVRQLLQARLDDASKPGNKAQKLARILLPLANEGEDRLKLYKRQFDQAEATPEEVVALEGRFATAFDAATSTSLDVKRSDGTPDKTKTRDVGEQRRTIASLLCRLCEVLRDDELPDAKADPKAAAEAANAPISEWKSYKRCLAVVGLSACQKALDDYTVALERATEGMQASVERDRDQFASALNRKLQVLDDYATRLEAEKTVEKNERDRATKAQEQANKTKVVYDRVEAELRAKQQDTKKMLDEQAKMEQNLFESRQRMRDVFAENQRLEQRIRELEQGR
jgi:hypothetical protein